MLNTETLKDLNLQIELINQNGCYKDKPNKKTYCITDTDLSKKTLLKMLNSCTKDPYTNYSNKLSALDLNSYINEGIYNEPLFNRNFVMVSFPFIKKDGNNQQTARFFRYQTDYNPNELFTELRERYYVLSKDNISFNEALFVLYGFNCQLVPDYDIRTSSNAIDKALINSKQGEMLIGLYTDKSFKQKKEFVEFATVNNFIKLTEGPNSSKDSNKKDRDIEIYEKWCECYPKIGNKYNSKTEVYQLIKTKQGLSLSISAIIKIINKKMQ